MYLRGTQFIFDPKYEEITNELLLKEEANEKSISNLAMRHRKRHIICFSSENDIDATQLFIEKVLSHLMQVYRLPQEPLDLFFINVPEFLDNHAKDKAIVSNILDLQYDVTHNNTDDLKNIASEIIEISNVVCDKLSKKNAPEHHELKDLIQQMIDGLNEFSTSLDKTNNLDELNKSKETAGEKINEFLTNIKDFNSKVDTLTDSYTGSFSLTCMASGLLIAIGVPPIYSLATGVSYFGNKHVNVKNILGMSGKDKVKG